MMSPQDNCFYKRLTKWDKESGIFYVLEHLLQAQQMQFGAAFAQPSPPPQNDLQQQQQILGGEGETLLSIFSLLHIIVVQVEPYVPHTKCGPHFYPKYITFLLFNIKIMCHVQQVRHIRAISSKYDTYEKNIKKTHFVVAFGEPHFHKNFSII